MAAIIRFLAIPLLIKLQALSSKSLVYFVSSEYSIVLQD